MPWRRWRLSGFRIYAGGSSPDNRVNTKILWSAAAPLAVRNLLVRGARVGGALAMLAYGRFGRRHAVYGRVGPFEVSALLVIAAASVAVAYAGANGLG